MIFPAALLVVRSCLVMIPSIRTSVWPFTVTAIMTRWSRIELPEFNICWTDRVLPQRQLELKSALAADRRSDRHFLSASMTACGHGAALNPPIINVR